MAGGGIGEIVGGLLYNGFHAGTEIINDDVKVAFVMRYYPCSYAGIPNGKTKSKDKLDVRVILRHSENEATGGNFEGDGSVEMSGNKGRVIEWLGFGGLWLDLVSIRCFYYGLTKWR